MDIRPGDVLEMKKEHPCGARRWEVLRVGMDFRLRCVGCGRCLAKCPISMNIVKVAKTLAEEVR